MIADNILLWQAFIWLVSGYLVSIVLNTMIGVPRRFIESS